MRVAAQRAEVEREEGVVKALRASASNLVRFHPFMCSLSLSRTLWLPSG